MEPYDDHMFYRAHIYDFTSNLVFFVNMYLEKYAYRFRLLHIKINSV